MSERRRHREWMAEYQSEPSHRATCDFHPTEFVFMCPCGNPRGPHMCDRCAAAAEDSKMSAPHLGRNDG